MAEASTLKCHRGVAGEGHGGSCRERSWAVLTQGSAQSAGRDPYRCSGCFPGSRVGVRPPWSRSHPVVQPCPARCASWRSLFRIIIVIRKTSPEVPRGTPRPTLTPAPSTSAFSSIRRSRPASWIQAGLRAAALAVRTRASRRFLRRIRSCFHRTVDRAPWPMGR